MYLDEGHVTHLPIVPLDLVSMPQLDISDPEFLSALQQEVLDEVMKRQDEFIRQLVDALMEPDPVYPGRPAFPKSLSSASGIGEHICRKHGHQAWCERMHTLRKYTMLAVAYHHARKQMRIHGNNMKTYILYSGLRSEARARFHGSQCDCGGLRKDSPFEPYKPNT